MTGSLQTLPGDTVAIRLVGPGGQPADRAEIPAGRRAEVRLQLRCTDDVPVDLRQDDALLLDFGVLSDKVVLSGSARVLSDTWRAHFPREGVMVLCPAGPIRLRKGDPPAEVAVSLPPLPARPEPHGTLYVKLTRSGRTAGEGDFDVTLLKPPRNRHGEPPVAVTWIEGPEIVLTAGERSSPSLVLLNHRRSHEGHVPEALADRGHHPGRDPRPKIQISFAAAAPGASGDAFRPASVRVPPGAGFTVAETREQVFEIVADKANRDILPPHGALFVTLQDLLAPDPGHYLVHVALLDFPGYDDAAFTVHVVSKRTAKGRP